MLGLFAFFYACVHLLSYMGFDRLFDVGGLLSDVAEQLFITAGMTALAVMIPLAVTSTKGWLRRLGRRWQTLHRLVYLGAVVACLRFVWKVRAVVGEIARTIATAGSRNISKNTAVRTDAGAQGATRRQRMTRDDVDSYSRHARRAQGVGQRFPDAGDDAGRHKRDAE